jgi:hypothetical protein
LKLSFNYNLPVYPGALANEKSQMKNGKWSALSSLRLAPTSSDL